MTTFPARTCWWIRFVLGISLLASPALAQTAAPSPSRPHLPSNADTNSARAYYVLGIDRLDRDPVEAAAAFYWATRLEPTFADALYGRHVALLLQNSERLLGWMRGDRRVMSAPEVLAIDSLRERALIVDPFLLRTLDDRIIFRFVEDVIIRTYRTVATERLQRDIRRYLEDTTDSTATAWLAFSRGQYARALTMWGPVARRDTANVDLRVDRATAYYMLGRFDSARTELEAALGAARRDDTVRIRHVYQSKASLEYALGRLLERTADTAGARGAYQRALIENLGYYPAHMRLALIGLAAGDTAAAVRELQRIIDIREDDYEARLMLGYLVGLSGRFDEALEHLVRASRAEPWAAAPVDLLAQIHDAAGHRTEALAAYQRFLQLSRRDDPGRGPVEQRLAALRGGEE